LSVLKRKRIATLRERSLGKETALAAVGFAPTANDSLHHIVGQLAVMVTVQGPMTMC
jgi:hypothetical protein